MHSLLKKKTKRSRFESLMMKIIRLYSDEFPFMPSMGQSNVLSKGRPRKGVPWKTTDMNKLNRLDKKFYLKLANYNEKEVDEFIKKYEPFSFGKNNENKTHREYILDFQKKLSRISKLLEILTERKNRRYFTNEIIGEATTELNNLINKDLASCCIRFSVSPLSNNELSTTQIESYEKTTMDNLLITLKDHGGVFNETKLLPFPMFYMQCDNIYSWCVLHLMNDKLNSTSIGVCNNCGRVFLKKRANAVYCDNTECKATRTNKRKQKSRLDKSVKHKKA